MFLLFFAALLPILAAIILALCSYVVVRVGLVLAALAFRALCWLARMVNEEARETEARLIPR